MTKIDLKVVAVCHNIISLGCKSSTPLTFGLGVKMHHDHGSKELIQDLNCLGHSINYDEVRRFLTAITVQQFSKQYGMGCTSLVASSYQAGNPETIVDAAIDNFDRNGETIDGKNTTQAMAIVLYQRSAPAFNELTRKLSPQIFAKMMRSGATISHETKMNLASYGKAI